MRPLATVLLADDHQATREVMTRVLSKEYDVISQVGDGEAAVAAVNSLDPDFVIMDISMPLLSGIDAARKISKRDGRPAIVFVTVHRDPAILEEGLDAGGLGYVLKHNMAFEILEALRLAKLGEVFVSPSLQQNS